MFDTTCPQCSTDTHVHGQSTPEGVLLTCTACERSWLRAERRCKSCGGAESLTRPQKLVVNPRGNQLATVGLSEARLCPLCDAAILVDSGPGQWLPDGYVSRFINGAPRTAKPERKQASVPEKQRSRPAPPPAWPSRPPSPTRSAQPPLTNPTVREAMNASLFEVSGLNPGVITLLAIRLGPSTRTKSLGAAVDSDHLAAWVSDSRLQASAWTTVEALVAHWRTQGWL